MNKCLFCQIIAWEIPCAKVYENEHVFAFLDIYPDSRFHTLVVPKEHSCNIYDIKEADLHAILSGVQYITWLYKEKLWIEHVNIVSNNGPHAQQEIAHTHYHIIPRSENDGLQISRTKHPERQQEFSEMLEKLR